MQFKHSDIHKLEAGKFWFECSMISTCKPVFDKCGDNYDVEKILRRAHVLLPSNRTDTESCALVVNFSSRASGEGFINRLNNYLASKTPEEP